jgi:hypothetical protein
MTFKDLRKIIADQRKALETKSKFYDPNYFWKGKKIITLDQLSNSLSISYFAIPAQPVGSHVDLDLNQQYYYSISNYLYFFTCIDYPKDLSLTLLSRSLTTGRSSLIEDSSPAQTTFLLLAARQILCI